MEQFKDSLKIRIVVLPDAFRGFLLGITIAGFILGAIVAKVGFERLRSWKKNSLRRVKKAENKRFFGKNVETITQL